MSDLSVNLFGEKISNPLFLPSGIVTVISSHNQAEKAGAGLVIIKSITVNKRIGNPIPRVVRYSSGFINSVGLTNPGLKQGKKQIDDFMAKTKIPVIISVFAEKVSDFVLLVKELSKLKPLAIELNLSCPNVRDELDIMISTREDITYTVTKAVKKAVRNVPIICKLSPNVSDIGGIAKSCEDAGADAISAINTVAAGMVIDIKTAKPTLGAKFGGLSGPGIKPISIAKVYEIYKAVKIPVLGLGGISTSDEVIEMMMAGAFLVGVGSAVYLDGYKVFDKIKIGMREFCKENKIKSLKKIVGVAHK